jgi:hypothetical protein
MMQLLEFGTIWFWLVILVASGLIYIILLAEILLNIINYSLHRRR